MPLSGDVAEVAVADVADATGVGVAGATAGAEGL